MLACVLSSYSTCDFDKGFRTTFDCVVNSLFNNENTGRYLDNINEYVIEALQGWSGHYSVFVKVKNKAETL